MFVGAITLVEDSGSIFTDIINGLSLLPTWFLIIIGIYIVLQIIHLVIYRDLRRFTLFNVMVVLIVTVVAFIMNKEIAKSIMDSNLYNDNSFVGAKLIGYIIHSVILITASIVTIITMFFRQAKTKKSTDSTKLTKSEAITMGVSGALLAMLMMMSFFSCSGARINIDLTDKTPGQISTHERYGLAIKENDLIRIGSYQMTIGEWDSDLVEVEVEQQSLRAVNQVLKWNTRYRLVDDESDGRFECTVKFTK